MLHSVKESGARKGRKDDAPNNFPTSGHLLYERSKAQMRRVCGSAPFDWLESPSHMFDHGKIRGELAISNVELSPQSKVK